MGTKWSYTNLTASFMSADALNSRFSEISDELDKCLYRDGTSPNTMLADLDMNSNDILNCASGNFDTIVVGGVDLTAQVAAAATSATNAATSETNAAASASAASSSASAAATSASSASTSASSAATSAAAAAAAGNSAIGGTWVFSNSTTMADPGTGTLRLNNATLSSVTSIAIDATSNDGGNPDLSDLFAYLDDTDQGSIVRITESGSPANFAVYNVTSVTDNTGWLQMSATHIASGGSFDDADDLVISLAVGGNNGGGSGTVTSVAVADAGSSEFTVTGSPITASGTINLAVANIAGTKITYSGGGDLDTAVAAAATVTGTETLTNKTLTSPVLTTPQINDTSLDHQYIVAPSELTADRTVTLPLLTGADEFVFKDHAVTLTNKTIALGSNTVSGTLSQVNTMITDANLTGEHMINVPYKAMIARSTNGAAAGSVETTTNNVMLGSFDFDASTDEAVQFYIELPESYNDGTITAQFTWSHPATATNFDVVWGMRAVSFADGDAFDAAFGTAVTVTDTGGTTDDKYTTAETSACTIAGTPLAGEMAVIEVYRDANSGSDTLAVDARLHSVRLYLTTDTTTDD